MTPPLWCSCPMYEYKGYRWNTGLLKVEEGGAG